MNTVNDKLITLNQRREGLVYRFNAAKRNLEISEVVATKVHYIKVLAEQLNIQNTLFNNTNLFEIKNLTKIITKEYESAKWEVQRAKEEINDVQEQLARLDDKIEMLTEIDKVRGEIKSW